MRLSKAGRPRTVCFGVIALVCAALTSAALAQTPTAPSQAAPPRPRGLVFAPVPPNGPTAPVQHIKVHGKSLEGNLEGNSADRDVLVILPPSYEAAKGRRYPAIYFLHGFGITGQYVSDFMHLPEGALISANKGQEFIIVVPDTDTKQGGSMYSSSPTTGDFEAFVARDLVAYIDAHYRTIARREGRGLAGHSMGGYGVWKIGMKYPEVWSSLYAMSACCVSPRTETVDQATKIAAVPIADAAKADFGTRAALASAVAWSPAPDKPPYYADFALKDGAIDPMVLAKWAANSPLVMVPQYIPGLKSMTAIAADVGDKDFLLKDDTSIHEELDRYGVANSFAVYPGDHVSGIAQRFKDNVLPFFAQHLAMK
jgi:enterochelin esterase-like enzyme